MNAATVASHTAKSGKTTTIALWIVTGLLGALFVLSGTMKFIKPGVAEQFAKWGYSDAFRILIGAGEIVCGLALLLPRTAFYAAGALGVIMAGAVYTHVAHGEVSHAVVPLVLLGLVCTVAYTRRRR
jgi:uncharacterized membrane protein YphA (DoxX/SURF4 family)